ncbi:MAG TPA: MBG domain-containing protein [Puia sp.]|nr:MBG domain-containing protein [Puia sp.]
MRETPGGIAAILITCCTLLAGYAAHAQIAGPPPSQQTLTISPATIPDGQYGVGYKTQTLKASGGKSPYAFTISAGSLPPGMMLSKDGGLSGNPAAAGGYSFTVAVQDNAKGKNAASGSQNYTLNINQASLTITAGNATMNAGTAIPALTVSYKGFVNGDNASSLTTPPTVTTTATAASPPGTYSITASGAVDPNYNISYNPGTLTINSAGGGNPGGGNPGGGGSIVVTAQRETKEYGAADPQLTYTVSGLPNGTTTSIFTGSLSRTPGENVGSYAITQGTLSAGAGHTFKFSGNYLTITRAEQHISWTQNLLVGCNTATQLQLSATASSGLPVTYEVSNPNVATVTGDVLTLHNPGTTMVIATQEGDADHAAAAAVVDTVVYQPESLINQHWSDVIFFDNSDGNFVGWQWYKNGDSIPGANLPYYSESPSLDGQYFVVATNKSGQEIQSCTLTINGDSTIAESLRVFPNPAKVGALVTVTGNYPGTALQGAILQVIDVNGRVRQQITAVQPSMQVTMPAQTGIYIIDLLLPGGQKASTNVLVD